MGIPVIIIVSAQGTMGRDKSFSLSHHPPRAFLFFPLSPASLRQKEASTEERDVSVCIITKGNETHYVYCSYVNLLSSEGLFSPSDMQQLISAHSRQKVSILARLTF